ncbi:MAG: hypothetical protein ACRCXC_02950 [Legionella sp.]
MAFTELERVVTDDVALEPMVLKKAFYTYEDPEGREKLEIWLARNDEIELPEEAGAVDHAKRLLSKSYRTRKAGGLTVVSSPNGCRRLVQTNF